MFAKTKITKDDNKASLSTNLYKASKYQVKCKKSHLGRDKSVGRNYI